MENLPPNEVLKNLKKKADEKKLLRPVSHARYALYVLSGFMFLFAIITFFAQNSTNVKGIEIVIYIALIVGGIFLGLGIWTKSQPRTAIIAALTFFLLLTISSGLGNPVDIYQNIWWQLIVLGLLVRGLLATKHFSKKEDNTELIDDI